MNRYLVYIFLLSCCFNLFGLDVAIGAYDPNKPSPFKLPKNKDPIYNEIEGYRTKFSRMTGIEFSGLHWNMGAVVYINMDSKVYVNNHIVHLQAFMNDDDDDDWEDEGDDFEDEDEFEEDDFEDEEEDVKKNKPMQYRVGTIIVKENYIMSESKPIAPSFLTVMVKREKNYDPSLGDWQYLQINADGSIIINDKGTNTIVKTSCSECHSNISNRDYIFSTYYTKIQPSSLNKK